MDSSGISIGTRIKARRIQLGYTQKDIERKTGITSGNISTLENGKSTPSATAIIALSSVLKCTTDWLLKGEETVTEDSVLDFLDEDERELIRAFRNFSKTDRQEILEYTEFKALKKTAVRKSYLSDQQETGNAG